MCLWCTAYAKICAHKKCKMGRGICLGFQTKFSWFFSKSDLSTLHETEHSRAVKNTSYKVLHKRTKQIIRRTKRPVRFLSIERSHNQKIDSINSRMTFSMLAKSAPSSSISCARNHHREIKKNNRSSNAQFTARRGINQIMRAEETSTSGMFASESFLFFSA